MRLTDHDRDLIKLIKAAKGDMQAVSYARDLRYYLVLWWSRQPHIAEALAEALAPTHSTPTHAKPALHTAAGPTTPPAQLNTPHHSALRHFLTTPRTPPCGCTVRP